MSWDRTVLFTTMPAKLSQLQELSYVHNRAVFNILNDFTNACHCLWNSHTWRDKRQAQCFLCRRLWGYVPEHILWHINIDLAHWTSYLQAMARITDYWWIQLKASVRTSVMTKQRLQLPARNVHVYKKTCLQLEPAPSAGTLSSTSFTTAEPRSKSPCFHTAVSSPSSLTSALDFCGVSLPAGNVVEVQDRYIWGPVWQVRKKEGLEGCRNPDTYHLASDLDNKGRKRWFICSVN